MVAHAHGFSRDLGVREPQVLRLDAAGGGRGRATARRQCSRPRPGAAASSSSGTRAPARSSSSRNFSAPSPTARVSTAPRPARAPLARAHTAPAPACGTQRISPGRQPATNASPRRASITASTGGVGASGVEPPARATAASRRRPAVAPVAPASACAVAIPIRSPVNVPGPTPTAIRSTSSQPPSCASSSSISDQQLLRVPRAPAGGRVVDRGEIRPSRRQTFGASSSRAARPRSRRRGVEGEHSHRDLDRSRGRRRRGSSVTRRAIRPSSRDLLLGRRRPFDEGDRVRADVVGEQVGILVAQRAEPVEVEVATRRDRRRGRVALTDRERRARDRLGDAERAAAPRTNVVLPAPSSPLISTTSPGCKRHAPARRRAPRSRHAERDLMLAPARPRPASGA